MNWDDVDWSATLAPEPPAIPVARLLTGPGRREAFRHHAAERLTGGLQTALHHGLRLLPADAASWACVPIGRALYRLRERHRPYVARMDGTIARLRPDLAGDPEARAALLARWFENTSRTFAEYAKLRSLADPARTARSGEEHLEAARATGRPLVVTFVHTGAWEVLATVASLGPFRRRFIGPYQPQPSRHENRIVVAARRRVETKGLPPGPHLPRTLLRFLSVPGQAVLIGIDEVSEGAIKFPLFGRPEASRCNLSFSVRAATRTGALVLPATFLRTGGAHFRLAWHPAIDVSAIGAEAAVATLDALYGPVVRANLDQWYMLHRLRL